jgi:hypothetical protein
MNKKTQIFVILVLLLVTIPIFIFKISPQPTDNTPSLETGTQNDIFPNGGNNYEPDDSSAFHEADTERKDYLTPGLALLDNESVGVLKLGTSDRDVISILGEPEKKSKAAVWGSDGLAHQTWSFPTKGIELEMSGEENEELKTAISTITITSACILRTKRDIGIGSSKEDVLKAYQNEINDEDSQSGEKNAKTGTIVAGSLYGGMVFHLKNNRVSSIFLGSSAE